MTIESGATRTEKARRALSLASWTTLGVIVANGLLATWAGSRAQPIPNSSPTGVLVIALVILLGVSALTVWVVAIWHAVCDTATKGVQKGLVVCGLIVMNFGGALLYYFLYVLWRSRRLPPVQVSER